MTATVTISGTWSEKVKPNNGLNTHAELIRGNRILRVPVVAFVEYHQWTETLTGEKLTVAIPVIEPCIEADGSDPAGLGKQVMDLLDQLRKQRGKSDVEDVPTGKEIAGQERLFEDEWDGDDDEPAETNASGDLVPPASGEEVVAELNERRSRRAKSAPAADFSDVPPNAGSAD